MSNIRDLEQRIRSLEQIVARQQREIERRPIRPGSTPIGSVVVIDQGNTLDDGSTLGIKYVSPISTVPSLYDPNVTSSFIDGIGRGTLYVNGVAQTGYVLVVNDGRASSLIQSALFRNDHVYVGVAPVPIPLASDSTQCVYAYVPYFL